MKLNRTGSNWNELERNKINENWDIIEGSYNDVVGQITDEVVGHLIDSAKLIWKEPVDTYGDLPTNAEVGETRMVREADPDGISYVYRYDGENWEKIQAIDVTLVNEVDRRLTAQLAQTKNKFNVEDWELNSKHRKKKGITVFVSDDGRIEEYTKMRPIHEAEGVPLCLSIVSNWVGKSNFCSREQLLELQSLGWEILSHSVNHPYNPVIKDMPDEEAEAEFRDSKIQLQNMGFNVQSMAYVGGNYGKREREFARKYYRAARGSDYGWDALNHSPIESAELKTFWVDTTAGFLRTYLQDPNRTREQAISDMLNLTKAHIDSAKNNNAIIIISTHAKEINEPDLLQLWQQIVQYAKQETEVMTLRDALNQMGNIIEVGDYSKMGTRALGGQRFVVGADGTIDGSATVVDPNKFTPTSHFNLFPFGVTYSPVNSGSASQAPEQAAGLLINYKVNNTDLGFNYQEYHIFGNRRKYKRFVRGDRTFGDWQHANEISVGLGDLYNPSTPSSDLPNGITYSVINASNATDAPEQAAGILFTFKTGGRSYQEYRTMVGGDVRRIYRRSILANGNYGAWKLIAPLVNMTSENSFSAATPFSAFPLGITYSIIQGNNPDLSHSPEGKNGTLVTHKFTETSIYGYNYQIYHVFNSSTGETYKRYATGADAWGSWVKTSG